MPTQQVTRFLPRAPRFTTSFAPRTNYTNGPQQECRNYNRGVPCATSLGQRCRHLHQCSGCHRYGHSEKDCFRVRAAQDYRCGSSYTTRQNSDNRNFSNQAQRNSSVIRETEQQQDSTAERPRVACNFCGGPHMKSFCPQLRQPFNPP